MSSKQHIHDAFIALEERHGWWDLAAFGQPYWHSIRHPLYTRVLHATGLMGQARGSWRDRPLSSWLKEVEPARWPQTAFRAQWLDLDRADVLVINHPRHVRWRGDWVCPYTHPLLDGLGPTHWVIEDVWQGIHSHTKAGARLKYLEWGFLAAQVGFVVRHGLLGGRLVRREREDVAEWCRELQIALGGGPSASIAMRLTRAAVRELSAFRQLYGRLLDRVQPKLIVQVVHYSYRCIPLTIMARERGIEVAELQHGALGSTHLAYNVAPGRKPQGFPDYLLTFGDWWRDMTPGLPLTPAKAPAIGFAWLEAQRRQVKRRRGSVLFISQGSAGEYLSKMAARLAGEKTGMRIRYKLHPGELLGWRGRYPWLVGADVEVVDQPTNIYDEFSTADVLVGVYSTAMFEGVAFGLPIVVAAGPGYEAMVPLIEAGAATLCEDGDLRRAIAVAEPPSDAVRARLFCSDPVRRFQEFVTERIGG